MRGPMLKALLFIAILSVFAADFSVGCGQGYVYGPVTQKLNTGGGNGDYLIAVDGATYDVPLSFYNQVRVGDTVKFDGRAWTIVKPAGASPASTPAPASTTP